MTIAIPIVLFAAFLYLVIYIVADNYQKRMLRLKEYERTNSVSKGHTPEALALNQHRTYIATYKVGDIPFVTPIEAYNYIDAKLQLIRNYNVSHTDIISVV